MHNKKIISKSLIISILLFNTPTNSMANVIEDYKLTLKDKEKETNSLQKNYSNELLDNMFDKFKKPKEVTKINKNIKVGTVKEINIGNGEFIPNLNGNTEGYETIRIITTGSKSLVKQDYDNLRTSEIPNIDLSNSYSTFIPEDSFKNARHLKSFKFPKGLKNIKKGAFSGCINLKGDLIIPEGVISIDDYAFKGCRGINGELVLPSSLEVIGKNAFENCSKLIGDLIIPDSVTTIGESAFSGCNGFNGKLKLSNSITTLENWAFNGCSKLTGDLVIPNSVSKIGDFTFRDCTGFNGSLMIPNSVKNIGNSAFRGCKNLKGILNIPNSVRYIGDYAFYRCSGFTGDLVIPNSVSKLGNSSFEGCIGFNGELKLSNSLNSIGTSTFRGCNGFIGNLSIPNSVKRIGDYVFYGCIGFNGKLTIPNSVSYIGYSAFRNCSGFKGSLNIPNSVTYIGDYAFYKCSGFTGDLVIPNSINIIGYSTFRECTGFNGELIIPKSVTEIGDFAFYGCNNLTGNIVIPDSVVSIDTRAFNKLDNVEKIVIKVSISDKDTNYKKSIIDKLPDTSQTVIDLPYSFNITETWLENTNKTIAKPIVNNIVNGEEKEFIDGAKGKEFSIYIPTPYEIKDIIVLKNKKKINLPEIDDYGKHIFTEPGIYKITIKTSSGSESVINFEIEDTRFEEAEKAVEKAESSNNIEDIEAARDLVNSLPESTKKDEFQDRLDVILPNLKLDTKKATAHLDVYIKTEIMLSLSLNTNNVTFEDFSGVEDMEKLNAVTLTVNSSLPYRINAYLPTEIIGNQAPEPMDKEIFNIRANGEDEYKTFTNTNTPIVLLDDLKEGNGKVHGIDLMLKSNLAYDKDVYKTVVKFEAEQK